MEWELETVPKLSNGTSFNDFEWPQSQISRLRHYLTLNILEAVRDTNIVSK